MIKATLLILAIIALLLFPLRFAVANSGFFREGIIEGLQTCRNDEDCIWVPTSCCDCDAGGSEMLINRQKETMFNILVRPICLEEPICTEENLCHNQEVFCDRTCKYGERTYTAPLLSR